MSARVEYLPVGKPAKAWDDYRDLFENLPIGLCRANAEVRLLAVNPAFAALLGYARPEDLIGRSGATLFENPALLTPILERASREGVARGFEVQLRRLDGGPVWVRSSCRAIRDESGRTIGFEAAVEDVTERRRAEDAVREREEKFRKIFHGSLDAIAIQTHPDWRYVEVNDEFERALGWRREDVIGRTPDELGVWIDPEEGRRFLDEGRRAGIVRNREVRLRARNGEERALLVSASMETIGGERVFVAFGREITERKRAEEELRRALARAEESDRLKTVFLANVSHEIRTPLNIILGCSSVVGEFLRETDDSGIADLVERIDRAGKRLVRTIQSILDISRIEAQSFTVRKSPIPLGAFVSKHVEDFRVFAESKSLELSFACEVDDARVDFDEYCLSQALANLLENAVKFTPKGSVRVRVHRGADGHTRLEVRDTGIGIDPAFRPRLFETFSQEESGMSRRFEGSGLGLALVKRYVELNGGALEVEGEKGAGTAFTIRFA